MWFNGRDVPLLNRHQWACSSEEDCDASLLSLGPFELLLAGDELVIGRAVETFVHIGRPG